MKQTPFFVKQTIHNLTEFNSKPIKVPKDFARIAKFTIGQIVSSGSWKYGFYDIDNHPDKDTILSVDPTYYRGDFTTHNNAYSPNRTHIISCSDNQTVRETIVDDNIPRHAYPLENDSSIICINQDGKITEDKVMTLNDVIAVNAGDNLYKFIQDESYLIPLEGEIVINGHRRIHKQVTYVTTAKDLHIEGIDNVLLAVFK